MVSSGPKKTKEEKKVKQKKKLFLSEADASKEQSFKVKLKKQSTYWWSTRHTDKSDTMPSNQKVGVKLSKSAKSKDRKQKIRASTALEDDDAIYARPTKSIGNRYFIGIVYDHKNNRHYTDVKMKVMGKSAPRIQVPSVVNVTLSQDMDPDDTQVNSRYGSEIWEIVVPLTEKEIKVLKKEGKISDVLTACADISADTVKEVDRRSKLGISNTLDELDIGIEFERDPDQEEEETKRNDKKLNKHGGGKKTHTVIEDDDVDVDAI